MSEDIENLASEVANIRYQLWVLTDKIPMTRSQYSEMEIVKARMYRLFEKLHGMATSIPKDDKGKEF